MNDPTTIPPTPDPVLRAFEQVSAKMDEFNKTLKRCYDLLLELQEWKNSVDSRLDFMEETRRPSNGAG